MDERWWFRNGGLWTKGASVRKHVTDRRCGGGH